MADSVCWPGVISQRHPQMRISRNCEAQTNSTIHLNCDAIIVAHFSESNTTASRAGLLTAVGIAHTASERLHDIRCRVERSFEILCEPMRVSP
jgi:hypothetical protein